MESRRIRSWGLSTVKIISTKLEPNLSFQGTADKLRLPVPSALQAPAWLA